MRKTSGLGWMLVAGLLFGLLGVFAGCGGGTSCPNCLSILLELPKPKVDAPKGSDEQIRVKLSVKDLDGWALPVGDGQLKRSGNIWFFETTTNKSGGVQVALFDVKEVSGADGTKMLRVGSSDAAFNLSDSGKGSLRGSGMTLRLLSSEGDALRYVEGGKLQDKTKPKKEFKFELSGTWWVDGRCKDSFRVEQVVSFASQSEAKAQKATWSGACK